MKLPGHLHGERSLPGQNVRRTLARAEQAAKVRLGIATRLHAVTNRFDRVRRHDRPLLALVVLDDECEEIELVGLRRTRLGFVFEVPFDLAERGVIVGFGRINFFAMIRSPDRCCRILNGYR